MTGGAPLRLMVVAAAYPSQPQPNLGTFVRALVEAWATRGIVTAVVAPRRAWDPVPEEIPHAGGGPAPRVLRPAFLPFSNRRLGPVSTFPLTVASFAAAVRRAAKRLAFAPEVVYGHFLFPAGAAALREAERRGAASAVALGESSLGYYEGAIGRERTSRTLRRFDGILSVSAGNRDHCVARLGVPPERILVVPNAPDAARFRPRGGPDGERDALRRALGLPADRVIAVFLGHFIERKGPLRVLAAIRDLPEVGAVFLGDGPERPTGDQVLFAGRVPHEAVPDWLCAADLFVLPTLAEGSPNAVLEALACGLPVVSSDIPALREAVDPSAALLVDPRDAAALREGVVALARDPERRRAMGEAARRIGSRFTLAERAERIAAWLEELAARRRNLA